MATPLELGPDETQYWFWSQTPAFGYFSKPPLIAWAIAASTALFGEAEWAVRAPALVFQSGAACFLFLLGRMLFSIRIGLWAGFLWLTMPGVILSSTLITTDAPLLFFWSGALYAFFSALNRLQSGGPHQGRLLAVGVFVGLGFLAKYAMIYFFAGLLLAVLMDSSTRRLLVSWTGLGAALIAIALAAPNIAWNGAHDFQTLSHTAANANWGGSLFHPIKLGEFLAGQFAVAGPIMVLVMGAAVFALLKKTDANSPKPKNHRLLIGFILPALAIISVQAFLSRAHANWASVAYPGAIVAACGFAMHHENAIWRKALMTSAGLHFIGAVAFMIIITIPGLPERVGAGDAVKRLQGWESHAAALKNAAAPYDTIMTDDREMMGELLYYLKRVSAPKAPKPIIAWDSNNRIDHHYEAFVAFDPTRHDRMLYVTQYPDALLIQNRFEKMTPLGDHVVTLGNGETRTLYFFDVATFVR